VFALTGRKWVNFDEKSEIEAAPKNFMISAATLVQAEIDSCMPKRSYPSHATVTL
jgi:hypothetical protein